MWTQDFFRWTEAQNKNCEWKSLQVLPEQCKLYVMLGSRHPFWLLWMGREDNQQASQCSVCNYRAAISIYFQGSDELLAHQVSDYLQKKKGGRENDKGGERHYSYMYISIYLPVSLLSRNLENQGMIWHTRLYQQTHLHSWNECMHIPKPKVLLWCFPPDLS